MNKILFVSYNHSLNSVADSVQNHRLIPSLSEYYDVTVIQRRFKGTRQGIWSPNIYIVDRILYKLLPSFFSVFSFDRWLWCMLAYKKIKKTINVYQYVIMVYEPYTTRFLHYRIKHDYPKQRVASLLYDPYTDNIFLGRSRVWVKQRKRIEKNIISLSDIIIAYNTKHLSLLKGRYPYAKIKGCEFCGHSPFSDEFFLNKARRGRLTLVHVGNIYGERKIDGLNRVVTILKTIQKELSARLQIIVYGTYCVGYNKVVIDGNGDVIKHASPRYGDDLYNCIKEADALLLIDPVDEGNTCFPSKLCEYYQYKKPIFAIAAKGTPSYVSLKEAGHVVYDNSELGLLANTIWDFIENPGFFDTSFDQSYDKQFYPNVVAKKLSNYLMSE